MEQHLQTTLFGFVISLILSTAFVANADTPQTTTSQVNYGYNYHSDDDLTKYYRFLASPAPEGLHYHARLIARANIDNTPEKETIILMVGQTSQGGADWGNGTKHFSLSLRRTPKQTRFPRKKSYSNFLLRGLTLGIPPPKPLNFKDHPPSSQDH